MHIVGVCGTSGSGKTRLAQRLVAEFAAQGVKISVIKHAHHNVDVDTPGKDSWVLRKAGAYETMLVSSRRWMLIRELEEENLNPDLREVIAQMQHCEWLIFEGFKHADLNKIEVWRQENGKPALYPQDNYVQALITADQDKLPEPTLLPIFSPDSAAEVVTWLQEHKALFKYQS